MQAAIQIFEEHDLEDEVTVTGRVDPRAEDLFWARAFAGESYYRGGLDYEDYAPAYCVGYVGHAQYGGDFADAERSLCANWERIKGDSRLSCEEALPAMRAAWMRMAGTREVQRVTHRHMAGVTRLLLQRLRSRAPSIKLGPSLAR